ncbi:MAG: TIGR00730 family Rossman fold protein [Candidatus Puniceispirillaceae bacterium]
MACLCVFAGAASGNSKNYEEQAYQLAASLAQSGYDFIYGGGRTGLMGAFADGVISQGGDIEGVIPAFLQDKEIAHEGVRKMTVTQTMHERKTKMYQPADGFLILPGGLGTLDETMEVLTWRQLGKLSGPVFVFSPKGYWDRMRDLILHIEQEGFAHSGGLGQIYWQHEIADMVSDCNKHFSS